MKNFKKRLLLIITSFFITLGAFAQDCTDGPGLPGDDPDAPTTECEVPLDNWICGLVTSAVLFGGYKLTTRKRELKMA